ncbi:hypothetical protein BASA81_017128 [Batrachochytrium salamandrivorans]|nr:hypothetical protein BASA81_017128 [Batrachochytrium salamandrivorans]
MKFNVLVVAAIVIASVNAVWHDNLPSGVENSGDMSKQNRKRAYYRDGMNPKYLSLLKTTQSVTLSSKN